MIFSLFGPFSRKQHIINSHLLSHEICFYSIMNDFKEISAISHVTYDVHENVAIFTTKKGSLTAPEIMMHSHIVAFPLFLQTHYIRNIAVQKFYVLI